METARCPGCGASVRPKAAWCSLCYYDLRGGLDTGSRLASATASQRSGAAPLVDAAVEPGPVQLSATAAFGDAIEDAEIVEADPAAQAAEGDAAARSGSWPCSCGTLVALAVNECPACGRPFLADLRVSAEVAGLPGLDNGRHRRRGGRFVQRLHASRALRLSLGALVAVVIAVLVPTVISLLG